MTTPRELAGRVALVTGSTSGIGLGIARALAKKGSYVILTGFADDDLINSLKEEFTKDYKVKVSYIAADLSEADQVTRLCDDVIEVYPSGVDILVNNAGFQHVCPIEDFPLEQWQSMMTVMLTAPFMLIQRLISGMRSKGWGRIINISSAHGLVASPNKAPYVTAKHGIIGLTKVVALESAGQGITSNAICPGYVETPILVNQVQALAEKEGITYDEAKIADLACFLCSDSAAQITGSSQVIDGGWTTR